MVSRLSARYTRALMPLIAQAGDIRYVSSYQLIMGDMLFLPPKWRFSGEVETTCNRGRKGEVHSSFGRSDAILSRSVPPIKHKTDVRCRVQEAEKKRATNRRCIFLDRALFLLLPSELVSREVPLNCVSDCRRGVPHAPRACFALRVCDGSIIMIQPKIEERNILGLIPHRRYQRSLMQQVSSAAAARTRRFPSGQSPAFSSAPSFRYICTCRKKVKDS